MTTATMMNGGAAALFANNIALMYWCLRPYIWRRFIETDDLIQEARIGLWKASLTWDPERGAKFGHYAVICIRGAIRNAIAKEFRQRRCGRPTTQSLETVAVSRDAPADAHAMLSDDLTKLRRLIGSLDATQAETIQQLADGQNAHEIAKQQSVTKAAVYRRVSQGIQRMQQKAEQPKPDSNVARLMQKQRELKERVSELYFQFYSTDMIAETLSEPAETVAELIVVIRDERAEMKRQQQASSTTPLLRKGWN